MSTPKKGCRKKVMHCGAPSTLSPHLLPSFHPLQAAQMGWWGGQVSLKTTCLPTCGLYILGIPPVVTHFLCTIISLHHTGYLPSAAKRSDVVVAVEQC